MEIRNLTDKIQGLRVMELPGGSVYTIFIEAKGTTTLQGAIVSDREKPRFDKGIFEYVGTEKVASIEELVDTLKDEDGDDVKVPGGDLGEEPAEIETEETVEDSNEESVDSISEESTEDDGKFICEECGEEFASARGLSMHMSRTHSEE